jgi:hypothetical protein
METIIRQVRELQNAERSAIEHLVGHVLHENQQLIIQVMTDDAPTSVSPTATVPTLPDWTRVYEGLSDEEMTEVENIALKRCNLSRSSS